MLGALVVSLAWSLGIITATVGHLTVFSVMFISLLVGLGIDYGIYILLRYEEELGLGRDPLTALQITASRTGPGVFFGALTAAGTFGVLAITEFRGIQEFGFVAGTAILMAFLAMMTLFPAVLVILRRRALVRAHRPRSGGTARRGGPTLARFWQRPIIILIGAGLLTAYSLASLPTVRFDYNRLNLQAGGTESVIWERRIMASSGSGFAALATADSLPELRDKQQAFERLPAVAEVVSVLRLIPAEQEAKIVFLSDVAPVITGIRFGSEPEADPAEVRGALETLRRRLGIALRESDAGVTAETLRSARDRADALLARLGRGGPAPTVQLAAIQARLRDDFLEKFQRLQDNLAPHPVTIRDLPDELTRRLVGRNGRLLMRIYPAIDTWNREGAWEFVSELRSVDAAVTGSPVISYEASRLMEAAYLHGTLYAVILVAGLTAFMFRRPSEALLALAPLALGTLWTLGFMRVFGLSFNLANVWGLPLIMGAAAEYGLNVTLRYQEGSADSPAVLPGSTVKAVLLNGLTTVAGFGSLMVAQHQGIFGLGLLLTVGAVAGLAASLVVLPVLLGLWCPAGVADHEPASRIGGSTN
jgi:predicted RND superfamily exporter protein